MTPTRAGFSVAAHGKTRDVHVKQLTHRLVPALLAATALSGLVACQDKGATVEPTTTSPSPTTVQTSKPMLPTSSVASASPEPGTGPT
jgi:hypothetical protein